MISDHELCVCVETYPLKIYISEKESLYRPNHTTTNNNIILPTSINVEQYGRRCFHYLAIRNISTTV
jgi:hypothetical protein